MINDNQSWWLIDHIGGFNLSFLGGEELSAHEHCLCCKYWYKTFVWECIILVKILINKNVQNFWSNIWHKYWDRYWLRLLPRYWVQMLVQCWCYVGASIVCADDIYWLFSQVALVLSLDPPLTWLYLKFSIRWFYWLIDSFNFEYISRFTAFFRTLVLSLDWLLPHGWLLPSQWCFSTLC